ncbi:MAG: ABC transporter permease subunit [candidate division Zixibacteria bacterium]|nr:ABC transporter permease subunit [candidate division Zixibacteria bacterium]
MKQTLHRGGIWLSWTGFTTLILAWYLFTSLGFIDPDIFPGPLAVVGATLTNVALPRLFQHMGISLLRVVVGFTVGGVVAVLLGIISGWYSRLGGVLATPIELTRPIPPLAWLPLAIMWLGLGEFSKIFIIFLGAFFPMFTNTYKGMLRIEPEILRAGQMLGLQGFRLLLKVAIPATLPDIATGMRVGWSYSFGCMVVAEMLAAKSGLGYMIMHAREMGQIAVIISGVMIIGMMSLLTDYIIQGIVVKGKLKWLSVSTAL